MPDDVPQPVGRPQGGMKSEKGRAAYWRMQYESAISALADLIAENTENVDLLRDLDDALCDALMAARHGKHDGMTVETHLEHLIQRVRTHVTSPAGGRAAEDGS